MCAICCVCCLLRVLCALSQCRAQPPEISDVGTAAGCDIQWKAGKNLTMKTMKKKVPVRHQHVWMYVWMQALALGCVLGLQRGTVPASSCAHRGVQLQHCRTQAKGKGQKPVIKTKTVRCDR